MLFRSQRGQATVEHVGITLAVAVMVGLFGGLLARSGLPGQIAGAIEQVLGGASAPAAITVAGVPPQLQALYAQATDYRVAPEQRPTLGDVRLQFEQQLGVAAGDAAFSAMVMDQVHRLMPDLDGRPHKYIWAGTDDGLGGFFGAHPDQPGVVETPLGAPSVHVVTRSESDALIAGVLTPHHPNGWNVARDLLDAIPLGPTKVVTGALLAWQTLDGAYHVWHDLTASGAAPPDVPPGLRAGDINIVWPVHRDIDFAHGPSSLRSNPLPTMHLVRITVIRDGSVYFQALVRSPG